jgi:hypothetical protein
VMKCYYDPKTNTYYELKIPLDHEAWMCLLFLRL